MTLFVPAAFGTSHRGVSSQSRRDGPHPAVTVVALLNRLSYLVRRRYPRPSLQTPRLPLPVRFFAVAFTVAISQALRMQSLAGPGLSVQVRSPLCSARLGIGCQS